MLPLKGFALALWLLTTPGRKQGTGRRMKDYGLRITDLGLVMDDSPWRSLSWRWSWSWSCSWSCFSDWNRTYFTLLAPSRSLRLAGHILAGHVLAGLAGLAILPALWIETEIEKSTPNGQSRAKKLRTSAIAIQPYASQWPLESVSLEQDSPHCTTSSRTTTGTTTTTATVTTPSHTAICAITFINAAPGYQTETTRTGQSKVSKLFAFRGGQDTPSAKTLRQK